MAVPLLKMANISGFSAQKRKLCYFMFFCLSSRRSNLGFVQKSHKAGECLSVSLLKTGKYVFSLLKIRDDQVNVFLPLLSGSLNSGFAQSGRLICDGCLAAQDRHICVVSLLKIRPKGSMFFLLFFLALSTRASLQQSFVLSWLCLCSKQSDMCGFSA